jgi:hypothetical protein
MSQNQLNFAHIRTINQSAAISESNATTLAGNPAHRVVYYTENTFETMETWTVEGDKAYLIRYVAKIPNYSDYLPVIQQMLDSFEIISSPASSSKQGNSPPEAHNMLIQRNDLAAVAIDLNGTDADIDDRLTFVITLDPQSGNITQFDPSNGFLVYTPNNVFAGSYLGSVGTDFFRYMVIDNSGTKSSNATVSIQYCPVATC